MNLRGTQHIQSVADGSYTLGFLWQPLRQGRQYGYPQFIDQEIEAWTCSHLVFHFYQSIICLSLSQRRCWKRQRGKRESLMVAGERSAFSLPWPLPPFASPSHVQAPCLRVPLHLPLWPVITHLPTQNPNSHDNQTSTQGRPGRRAASSEPETQSIPDSVPVIYVSPPQLGNGALGTRRHVSCV